MVHPVRIHRHILTLVLILLAGAAIDLRAQAPAWKTYSYPSDGFSAAYPSEPQLSKKDIPTDAGAFELRTYVGNAEDSVALFIGVCDYGSKADGTNPDTMLEGAKGGALTNSKSHLVSEKKIMLGVYPGLAFESESDDGSALFSARIYVVGTTLYQTLVVSPLKRPYPNTQQFLDSFQLIARDRS